VDVALNLLVNKQNTADPSHWHLPTPHQTGGYGRAIVQTANRALESICLGPGMERVRQPEVWAAANRERSTSQHPKRCVA
jgi:hypothetical protein